MRAALPPAPEPHAAVMRPLSPEAERVLAAMNGGAGLGPDPERMIAPDLSLAPELEAAVSELAPPLEDRLQPSIAFINSLAALHAGPSRNATLTQAFVNGTCKAGTEGAFALGELMVAGNGTFVSPGALINTTSHASVVDGRKATFVAGRFPTNCTVTNGTLTMLKKVGVPAAVNVSLSWNGTIAAFGFATYQTPNGTVGVAVGNSSFSGGPLENVFFTGSLVEAFGSGTILDGTDFTVAGDRVVCTGQGMFSGNGTAFGAFSAAGTGTANLTSGTVNGTGLFYTFGRGGGCTELKLKEVGAEALVVNGTML